MSSERSDHSNDGRNSGGRRRFRSLIRMMFATKTRTKTKSTKTKSNKKQTPAEKVEVQEDFGIGETEKLRHFQRARPPANRRRPISSGGQQRVRRCKDSLASGTSMIENDKEINAVADKDKLKDRQMALSLAKSFQRSAGNVGDLNRDEVDEVPMSSSEMHSESFSRSVPNLGMAEQPNSIREHVQGTCDIEMLSLGAFLPPRSGDSKVRTDCSISSSQRDDVTVDVTVDDVHMRENKHKRKCRSNSFSEETKNGSSYRQVTAAAHKSTPIPLVSN